MHYTSNICLELIAFCANVMKVICTDQKLYININSADVNINNK